jgi:hypothetical protein
MLDHVPDVGISHECIRWGWPLAARAAHELADTAAIDDLVALLDRYPPGYLAPMLLAERGLVRARRSAGGGHDDAAAAFAAAISGLREMSIPYQLAHGLIDYAEYLAGQGDAEAAGQATAEARGIAERLGCQPLLDRAAALTPAPSRQRA